MNTTSIFTITINMSEGIKIELNKQRPISSRYMKDMYYLGVSQNMN